MLDWKRKCNIYQDFVQRRSGMVISHLSGCLENQRSPCERRVTDCVPFYELLEVLAEEVAVSTFVSRVCRLTGRRNPCFFKMVIENGFGYGREV